MKLISKLEFLMPARLKYPTISLQLHGDLAYDRLRGCLESGRRRSLMSYGQKLLEIVTRATNPELHLQEDIRFLNSLQSVANGSDEQRIVDETKQVAAEILDRRVERTINSFVRVLESKLRTRAMIELGREVTENDRQKTFAAFNTLRTKLIEELDRLNSAPGTS